MQKMGSWCRGMPRHQLTNHDPIEFPDLALHKRTQAQRFITGEFICHEAIMQFDR
jgi:hypothetical protein